MKNVADYGEWNRKGATIGDVAAKKEYGVDRKFIVKGIQAVKLEYREWVMWVNPYLRILRNQLGVPDKFSGVLQMCRRARR